MGLLSAILCFGCLILAACAPEVRKFYTLEEAYKKHFLSKDDMRAISEANFDYSGVLDEEIKTALCEDYLRYWNENKAQKIELEDVKLFSCMGEYDGLYIVQLSISDTSLAELNECEVGGIVIRYSGPELLAWRYE